MSLRRIIAFITASLFIIGLSILFNTHQAASSSSQANHISIGLEGAASYATAKTTAELISFWQSRFERDPRDYISLTYLGQTYLNKARETGNASDYAQAEAILRQALELNSNYELALAYLSTALFVQHEFADALAMAQRVYNFDPQALHALGTIGDSYLELGRYDEAETAYRTLQEQNPSPPVYSRLARLAWLKGNPDEAITQMRLAVDEANTLGLLGERSAWYHFQLGELYFNTGQLALALAQYTQANTRFEGYYLAQIGLAKVHAAQGKYDQAIAEYEKIVAIIPQPETLIALGDLYTLTNQPEAAQRHYDTLTVIATLEAANEVIYNRQLAYFYTDHDIYLDKALSFTLAELAIRKDIYGYDAAAWAYYKNGDFEKAQAHITKAMQPGTRDAKLYYHAGMIALANDRPEQATQLLSEALVINPYFDLLQAVEARETLSALRAN